MSSAVPNLERMYECGDVLANYKAVRMLQAAYEEILAGVKGTNNCKRLSSQFIARFFSLYPGLGTPSEWICWLSLVFVQTTFTSFPPLRTLETLQYLSSKLAPAPSLPKVGSSGR